MDVEKLAEVLRRLRGTRSQAKAAKAAGVSLPTIERLEGAKTAHPTFESLAALCHVYGASLDALAVEVGIFEEETVKQHWTEEAKEATRQVKEAFEELRFNEQRELADLILKAIEFYKFSK